VRIFATKWFARFARRERIGNDGLREAVARAEQGLVDADLGGAVIKQRVARSGQGRSGGYRVLIAYRRGNRAVFLYGFAKNERENIDRSELQSLHDIAAGWHKASDRDLERSIAQGLLYEVDDGGKTEEA
jgi:hypothetical protein